MNYRIDHIGYREDPFLLWKFIVSDSFIEEIHNCNFSVLNKIYEFYNDYIDIAIKYSIGEIIPRKCFDKKVTFSKDEYIQLCKDFFDKTDFVGFFPLLNIKKYFPDHEYHRLHPNACLYNLRDDKNKLHSDYFYINKSGIQPIKNFDYRKLPYKQDNFEIHGFGASIDHFDAITKDDIGFSIEIHSEFWHEKAFWDTGDSWEKGIDNRWVALHNSPRLNSFLNALMDVWINKYEWELAYFEGWYESRKEGILIDGQIIYQEDIDEGRVKISKFNHPT